MEEVACGMIVRERRAAECESGGASWTIRREGEETVFRRRGNVRRLEALGESGSVVLPCDWASPPGRSLEGEGGAVQTS